ncbi:MAG: membrane protein insertion efficiency factor YidD, partial [Candidatus Bathyarchaeota archaeon]
YISPLFSHTCRYYPTCSQYAIDAVNEYGLASIILIIKRIIKCNPYCAGGHDPVPKNRGGLNYASIK